jgi:hypothetical protein
MSRSDFVHAGIAAKRWIMIRNSTALTVALATLMLGVPQAHAQLAPWQQPPGRDGAQMSNGLKWLPADSDSPAAPAVDRSSKVRPAGAVRATDNPAAPAEKGVAAQSSAPVPDDALPGASEFAAEPPHDAAAGPSFGPGPGCGCTQGAGSDCGPMPCDDDGHECCRGAILGGQCGLLEAFYDRCIQNRLWFHADEAIYWTKGGNLPPLLSTSTSGTGAQGDPGYSVLLGNEPMNERIHNGEHLELGYWLDCTQDTGVEFTYLNLRPTTDQVTFNNPGTSILARPFFNTATNAYDSQVLASPATAGGTVTSGALTAVASDKFQVFEALWRRALTHGEWYRIDLLVGFRHQRLDDSLLVTASTTTAPNTLGETDSFATRNAFYGAEVGFLTEWQYCRWSMETNVKVALGNSHSRVDIAGTSTLNGNNPTSPPPYGGLLALPSNIGEYNNNQFTMAPELNATLAYSLTPQLRLTAAYTFMYWGAVARAGEQIDTNIDPQQAPRFDNVVPPTGVKPAFQMRLSDYWAQGVNLGLDYKF